MDFPIEILVIQRSNPLRDSGYFSKERGMIYQQEINSVQIEQIK